MFDGDFLALRLVRLKSSEELTSEKDGLCFAFFKGGLGQFATGTAMYKLVSGDMIVWEANPKAKIAAAIGGEVTFWSFSIQMEHLFPLFSGDEISFLEPVITTFKDAKFFPAAATLSIKCHRLIDEISPKSDLECRSQLLNVAALVLNEEFKSVHRQRINLGQVEERIIRVFEELSVDQLLGLSAVELAAKFGCSRRHLNRLFHQYFGFSVGALRMEMRLLKAVSLLRDVNTKVINVAEQCGFNHLGLFNTCFKRRFGISPGRWRKQESAMGKTQPAAVPKEDGACPLQIKGLCPLFVSPMANGMPVGPQSALFRNLLATKSLPGSIGGEHATDHHSPPTAVSERPSSRA
jgi:AraC-like DNA-binding protein